MPNLADYANPVRKCPFTARLYTIRKITQHTERSYTPRASFHSQRFPPQKHLRAHKKLRRARGGARIQRIGYDSPRAAQLEQLPYDYLVINDGSTDNTAEILDEVGAPHINLCRNLGIGGAVQTGYKFAYANGYDIAVQFDGDGQHDASCIERLIAPIREGEADFVVGSRFVSSDNTFLSTRSRRTGIFILSKLIQLVTGTRVFDVTSGFRAANRRIIKQFVDYYPTDYPEPETLAGILAGDMRVEEVGVIMHERAGGTSSISAISSVYYMLKVGLSILLVRPYERR